MCHILRITGRINIDYGYNLLLNSLSQLKIIFSTSTSLTRDRRGDVKGLKLSVMPCVSPVVIICEDPVSVPM